MSAIDYDLTKIRAFVFDVDGVLSPSVIPIDDDGQPRRMANIKDGYVLQLAVRLGYKIAIISGGKTESVRERYNQLGIKNIFLGAAHKLPVLKEWMEMNGLQPDEVMYMGDDIPDLMAMRYVGLPCTPNDGCGECKATARYVSRFGGGYGCVRDVVEQILKAQDEWMADDRAFGW